MSSHHIIRENQEPALAFLNTHRLRREILDSALEWSPYVVAAEAPAFFLVEKGIKIDAVVGSNVKAFNELKQIQTPLKFVRIRKDNPTEAVIDYLESHGHQAVNIFKNFDSSDMQLAQSSALAINIIDGPVKWSCIRSGFVKKWFPKGATISIAGVNVLIESQDTPLKLGALKKLARAGTLRFSAGEPFWLGEHIT